MRFNTCVRLFVSQCMIFLVNGKALVGHNITRAHPGEYVYIVSVMRVEPGHPHSGGQHFCTGVLVSRKDVLTSAHCLEDESLNTVQIVIGTVDIANGTVYFPFWWQTHDQWAEANNVTLEFNANDIANIRLILLVPRQLHPARLSSLSNTDLYGADVITTSWGINNQAITPDIMEIAHLKVLTIPQCERKIEKLAHQRLTVNVRIICTDMKPYILLKSGDSGGPLLFRNRLVAVNKGRSPQVAYVNNFHKKQVNLHVGTHYYRIFINYMKNLF